jgi:hypothetical protein
MFGLNDLPTLISIFGVLLVYGTNVIAQNVILKILGQNADFWDEMHRILICDETGDK